MKRVSPGLFALRGEISRGLYSTTTAIVFAFLIAVWCSLSYGELASPIFLPTPTRVGLAAVEMYEHDVLVADLLISNFRIWFGFLVATAVAIPLGMLAGNIRVFEAIIEPLLGFLRYMPVPAFIPLLILYTGIGETTKVLVIFIGAVVQMVLMVADATKQTSAELIRAAMALGAHPRELFTKVIWRSSLPGIFDVLRLNLGWAWTYLVVAEMVAANEGLGYRILKSQRFIRVDIIFLYLFFIGGLGVTSDLAFRYVQRKLFPWAEEKVRS